VKKSGPSTLNSMQQEHKAHQTWALQLQIPKAILDMEAK
jgi:hypothetical protein